MRFLLEIIPVGELVAFRLAYIRFLLRPEVKGQPLLRFHVIGFFFGGRHVNR
jgi:hypothetical protein